MDFPNKPRPKSAPVITNAYVQNRREEECLYVKLNGMHCQHHADMMRWRQAVDNVVRKRQNLLLQRAITPQSTLERVMDEIQTFKKYRSTPKSAKVNLPLSTEVSGDLGSYSKWVSSSSSQNLHSVPSYDDEARCGGPNASCSTRSRTFPAMRGPQIKPHEIMSKIPETSERKVEKKQRPLSTLQRKPDSIESLTYKELGGIARLENISMRETERQKQIKLLEREQISKTHDTALQQKVDTFLKKFE
ncbi:uncharacterized protein LOC134585439 [Pelobates fuscus]|uniref:uncharacterized protein LOC134585439 n=1 Tax=Pelobates fuscus TaxID=191477 RepID=UPI002FE4DF6D